MSEDSTRMHNDCDIVSDSQSSDDHLELRARLVQPGSVMLITDDTDQQFWGDNELESTSQSDLENADIGKIQANKLAQVGVFSQRLHLIQKQYSRKTRDTRLQHFSDVEPSTSPSSPRDKTFSGKSKRDPEPSVTLISRHLNDMCLSSKPGTSTTPGLHFRTRLPLQARNRVAKRTRDVEPDSAVKNSSSESECSSMRPPPKRRLLRHQLPNGVTSLPGERCPKCNVRPKNAIIMHGAIGHQCYCYQCTMKLMRINGRCGMCQRHIRTVANVRDGKSGAGAERRVGRS